MEYALNVLYRKLKTNLTEVCVVYENKKKKIKTFQKVIKISFLLLVENFFVLRILKFCACLKNLVLKTIKTCI